MTCRLSGQSGLVSSSRGQSAPTQQCWHLRSPPSLYERGEQVMARAATWRWRILRRGGWTRLKELRNTLVLAHPLFCTSGKIFVFIRHLALKCLSFRVVKLLRSLSRFVRSEAPVSRISQKLRHSRHSGSIHTGGGGYETSARERHIQRQSRPQKRPIRRYLFPWMCFPENTQATSKQLFGSERSSLIAGARQ